jgi:hypothetical protein
MTALLLFGFLAACGAATPVSDPTSPPTCEQAGETLLKCKADMEQMIADLSCSADSDCASFPFGAKPCGGPWQYVVYSRPNVDESRLAEKAKECGALLVAVNKVCPPTLSDCMMVDAPKLSCEAGRCAVRPN